MLLTLRARSQRRAPAASAQPRTAAARAATAACRTARFRLSPAPLGTSLPRPVSAIPATLATNLAAVRDRIALAERRSGRPAGAVTLIGVVKTLPAETIARAVELGLADLGENRVQEAQAHQHEVPRGAARWHMVGHLQRNKAARALELFDLVHGVDDAELARVLDRRAREVGRRLAVLVEVNVSGEASKFGVAPEAVAALAEQVVSLAGLELRGLMTVGAPVTAAEHARPGF